MRHLLRPTEPRRAVARRLAACAAWIAAALATVAQDAAPPETGAAGEAAASPAGAAELSPWTDSDTKLANHYLRLLEQKPEYGAVFDLLWDLYDKRGQTGLLMGYISQAAEEQGSLPARVLRAHLLRKSSRLDDAREAYGDILEDHPDDLIALRGAAELNDQQERTAKALSHYRRLAELVPAASEDGAAFRLRQASLLRESGQVEEAVAIWNELLAAAPGNQILRGEIVALLVEAGRPEEAIAALRQMASAGDPETRLASLDSLARLHEFISEFDGAAEAIMAALDMLHFRHHDHAALFERLVRLHERFDRLPELELRLEEQASQDHPTESAVFLMAEFHRLTANPAAEEIWADKLASLVPSNVDYQLRLVQSRMQNDHYAEAAQALDALLASQAEAPLGLTLLRSRVALNLEGREAAEAVVDAWLSRWPQADASSLGSILAFAREYYLDGLVESLLSGEQGRRLARGEGDTAPGDLARFFHERGRSREAEALLLGYVAEAAGSSVLKASRLAEVGAVFRDLDLTAAAVAALDEAVALAPENPDYRLARAELHIQQKETEAAIAAFEAIRERQPDLAAKAEIDQRIFSLLRGLIDETEPAPGSAAGSGAFTGPPRTVEEYRRMAAAVNRAARAADEPPPERLTRYYEQVKEAAERQPSLETRYRAAWWAMKLQDTAEASLQLNTAKAEAGDSPEVEVERLMLALAEFYEQYPLIARQLELLSRIDPENAAEYAQRRAEVRFQLGYEDEGVRALEELARQPDAPLSVTKSLATLYQRQGRSQAQVGLWQDAYRRANLHEKRAIIRQLSATLVELGQHEEALQAEMDLVSRETDLVQKRKQFESQLALASRHFLVDWITARYRDLAQRHPFDRFYPEALARCLRAKGENEEAFAAMKRAYYLSGQDRELLVELGELAGLTRDLKAAIYYRRQVVAMNDDEATPETWRSLVEMMERDLRVGEADKIRERLETRFTSDPDFLSQLAREYREAGRLADASRALERLTSLRPWDAPSWLALGLTLKEQGREAPAAEAFGKAIAESGESALARGEDGALALWPVISGDRERNPAAGLDDPAAGPLRSMLRTVSDYPFLGAEDQESIVGWLEKSRPEFDRLPGRPRDIRLRAIEEAARLHGQDPGARQEWVRRWLDDAEAADTEKLWALCHAGAGEEAFALARAVAGPEPSALGRFLASLVALRTGQGQALVEWTRGGDPAQRAIPQLALVAVLRDPGGPTPSPEEVAAVAGSASLSPAAASFLFGSIRGEAAPEALLAFGGALADRFPRQAGELMLELAQIAARLGREPERLAWLRRCLDHLEPHHQGGLPHYYFQAATELHQLLESAPERAALLEELGQRFEGHPAAGQIARLENRLMLALIAGDGDAAAAALESLVERQIDRGRPDRRDTDGTGYSRIRGWGWSHAERILNAYAARRPLSMDPDDFFAALDPDLGADPRNLDAVTDYEQFEIERVCWSLEHLSPPERQRETALLFGRLREPGSRMQLARVLESRGFLREAIPIYRALVAGGPDEITPARHFLAACKEALEHEAALELIEAYLSGESSPPTGLALDSLYRDHAEFLLMANDLETLTARAAGTRPPGGAVNDPRRGSLLLPEGMDESVFYQSALIQAHERRGNDEATLRVLTHLRDQNRITKDERVAAGAMLLRRGDREGAREWWESVALDQQQPMAEARAIRELAALHAGAQPPDRAALGQMMRAAAAYENAALTRDVAGDLFAAGASGEARGALLLAARRPGVSPGERGELLADLVRLRLEHGDSVDEAAPDLKVLLENFPSGADALRSWLQLVAARGPADPGAWLAALAPWQEIPGTRLAARLAILWLDEALAAETDLAAAGFSPEEIDLAIESLPALGQAGAAASRGLLERRAAPDATLCEGDPERQARLFGELGDRFRAAGVHSRLFAEAEADGFQQLAARRQSGVAFPLRWHLPGVFAEAGFPDLARSLYHRYHGSIRRLGKEHGGFVGAYGRFLIETGDHASAESVLIPAFQKSIGLDPELLAGLYLSWGCPERLQSRLPDLHFTSGVVARLEQIRAAGGKAPAQP